VILLHDGGGYRGATVAALPSIIEFYRDLGYRFVRLDGR
jgi:peptidoglycan/xylan/chitin deacetylase (PgdA/CDA1 family)